jgi:hypothetical protein
MVEIIMATIDIKTMLLSVIKIKLKFNIFNL